MTLPVSLIRTLPTFLLVVSVFLYPQVAEPASAPLLTVGPCETVLPHRAKPYSWPDGRMGIMKIGALHYFFAARDSGSLKTVGTLENPLLISSTPIVITGMKSTSYSYVGGGPIYRDPTTGLLLMFYHAERWVQGNWQVFQGAVGMAKSMDRGATWTDLGIIIMPKVRFSESFTGSCWSPGNPCVDTGGGAFIVRDGYFYLYFRDKVEREVNVAVARAAVADVISVAIERDSVVSWMKYFEGDWSEPGLGGNASPLDATNRFFAWYDISFNSARQKYIAIGFGLPWPATGVYYAESVDGIVWSRPVRIAQDNAHNAYFTIVDPSVDPLLRTTGSEFYIYYVSSLAFTRGESRNTDGVLMRRLITLRHHAQSDPESSLTVTTDNTVTAPACHQ